jgi:large-conductance mechanosensitive channel
MLKEFKEFAMRGNVLDMAIGIVSAPPSEGSSRHLWKTS